MIDGLYTDLTIEEYHDNRTHLSATQLKIAKKSLKEFDWYRQGKIVREDKVQFSFGNAFELALLDSDGFSKKVAIAKDSEWVAEALKEKAYDKPRLSGTYQRLSREFEIGRAGMYRINDKGPESWETIQAMLESCYQDRLIQQLIKNTEYQLSVFWTDEQSGLQLKTRPDICKRKKNVIINVKTILDGSPGEFSRDLVKWDYPLQACHEIKGCLKGGVIESLDNFNYFWLVVEKTPPYNATIYEFTEEDIQLGFDEMQYLYNRIAKAEKARLYPGYSDRADNEYGILRANIPPYYRSF